MYGYWNDFLETHLEIMLQDMMHLLLLDFELMLSLYGVMYRLNRIQKDVLTDHGLYCLLDAGMLFLNIILPSQQLRVELLLALSLAHKPRNGANTDSVLLGYVVVHLIFN